MTKPKVLVLAGLGINCEEETAFAFEKAGAEAETVHVNDLIGSRRLANYQVLTFPGGFSYGDDTGAGNALANRIRNHLKDEIGNFVFERDTLVLGICNGFQVIANLGLLPAFNPGHTRFNTDVALVANESARYINRWVDLKFGNKSPWTAGIGEISLPIAHGEGRFYASADVISRVERQGLVAARYLSGEICRYQSLPANPNGSMNEIAGITDVSGRVLGMMPHPERAIDFTHLPHWTFLKEQYRRAGKETPEEGPGLQIFRNAVRYFK